MWANETECLSLKSNIVENPFTHLNKGTAFDYSKSQVGTQIASNTRY